MFITEDPGEQSASKFLQVVWQNQVPYSCGTAASISLLAVSWGPLSSQGPLLPLLVPGPYNLWSFSCLDSLTSPSAVSLFCCFTAFLWLFCLLLLLRAHLILLGPFVHTTPIDNLHYFKVSWLVTITSSAKSTERRLVFQWIASNKNLEGGMAGNLRILPNVASIFHIGFNVILLKSKHRLSFPYQDMDDLLILSSRVLVPPELGEQQCQKMYFPRCCIVSDAKIVFLLWLKFLKSVSSPYPTPHLGSPF